MNFLERITHHDPSKTALQDNGGSLLYGELDAAITAKAEKLKDIPCAALALNNSVEWVLWDLAAIKSGTTIVPIPPFFTPAQADHAIQTAGCRALITGQGVQTTSISSKSPPPDGIAKITFTSGTTGTPKGVCLPQSAMVRVAESIVEIVGIKYAGHHCSVLPLAVLLENVAGVYTGLLAGCTIHLLPLENLGDQYNKLHKNLLATGATSAILVPEILRSLMKQVRVYGPLPDLKFLAVGGAKVSSELIVQARAMGLPVYEGYGLSECASVVALNTPDKDKPGTAGRLLPHVRAHMDKQEIVIENPGFSGYIGECHTGAFRTGDLGNFDEKGFLSITGRKKNILITSYGRNISPEWVESILLAQPEISQAIVYGDALPHLSALVVSSSLDADIGSAVTRANAFLPDYARIAHYDVTPPFTCGNGLLTGTGRPRRDDILKHYGKGNAMTFYELLIHDTESARKELYSVPQLIDGLNGDISCETYIAYLTEAYHHVRHTVRFLMAMGARLPDEKKWLHDAISEYIDEEKGHEEWILDDIEAAGGDKEAARRALPNLETQVLVAYNYDYIARKNPVGFLGMVFMLESTSIQIANKGADAVKDKIGLPKNAFSYLYSHGALDIEHMKFFEQTVNRIDDPDDQAAITEVAQNTFRLFASLMRSIPHKGMIRNAA